MSPEAHAVLLNAVPLFVLAAIYLAAAGSLLPSLWRERGAARELEYALALVFPCGGVAAGLFGVLVLLDREPVGGRPWIALAAIAIAAVPGFVFFARWRDRALLLTGSRRAREAAERESAHERELAAVTSVAHALERSRDPESAARVVLDQVAEGVGVEFTALAVVDEQADTATGLLARASGRDVEWWRELAIDLGEPSGIATAVFEAAPFTIYDVRSSPHANRRLSEQIGAKSAAFVPLVSGERVIGVLVAVTTGELRAFGRDELSLMEALAREAALALERNAPGSSRRHEENERRLRRQGALLSVAQVLTSELELDAVMHRVAGEVAELVGADAADCWLFDEKHRLVCRAVAGLPESEVGRELVPGGTMAAAIAARRAVLTRDFARVEHPPPSPSYLEFEEVIDAPIIVGDDVRGVLGVCSRSQNRFTDDDLDLLDAVAALAAVAIRNAATFEDRSRQARIHHGFFRIATVLGESLSLRATLDAVAQAAAESLDGAFAAVVAPRGDTLEVAGAHQLPPHVADAFQSGRLAADGALEIAASDRRIVASASAAADERFEPPWRELIGSNGVLAVPIESPRLDPRAFALVFFDGERRFTNDDLELATHLAAAARGALVRSEIFEAERTSRALAQQLARTGSVLATELDPAAVLDEVVQQAPTLVGADACVIRVVDGDELVVSAAEGDGAEDALGARSDATGWLSGDVVQSRSPLAVEDARRDPRLVELDAVIAGGYSAYLGVPLVGPEGTLHGVLAVYGRKPRAWRDEEVEALLALAANTSAALSNAELYQRVALEKERSFAILANIADGIVAVDREGKVVLWNKAAEQITGIPSAEALGRTPQQVLRRDLESGQPESTGDRLVAVVRGGEEIWLSVTEAVMHDPAGLVAGRIFAFRDISADRLVEQMKSDFVSAVSHELRTPLTSIYGFAETLLRQDVLFGEEERRTFLGYISSESERLTGIVDALLNVARLDTGDLQVNVAPTDVQTVVSEVVMTAEEAAGANGHRFVLDLPQEPLSAEADADKLRQVLSQLVDNAVKYSPDGGTVTVSARRKGDAVVEFLVADEGIGIPAGEQRRIFRKFYRADAGGRDTRGGGTGLGLFIVQGLVSAMGGRIWVESAEGEGSRFAFELPAADAVAVAAGE